MAIPFELNDLDSRTEQISASAATIYGYRIKNRNAYTIYVKFYNKLAANVAATTDDPALIVTVPALSEATDETEHAFATALSVRCTTHSLNYDTNCPAVSPEIELQLTASGGGGSSALTPADDIQTALDAASAGDTILLGPGTWDLDGGYLEIPNDVNLKGAGMNLSIITSNRLGTSAPFHGIVAPGNNSVLEDLGIVAIAPNDEHVNALSIRDGSTKSWTNVTYRRCHLYGGADCVYSAGSTGLGVITFYDCFLEGMNDIIMSQTPNDDLTFYNCILQHTTLAGKEFLSASILVILGGKGKAYNCQLRIRGASNASTTFWGIEADGRLEVYDTVLDTVGQTLGGITDLSVDSANSVILSNVRRADGAPLHIYSGSLAPICLTPVMFDNMTVAKLPVSPSLGLTAIVSDGSGTPAWGDTVAGGGSSKFLVMWNGTAWKVIGK